MSALKMLINQRGAVRVSLLRATRSRDANGGTIEAWSTTVASNKRAAQIPKKKSGAQSDLGRRDWVREVEWAVYDLDATPPQVGDRLYDGTHYYDILDAHLWQHDQVLADSFYQLKTMQRRKQ